MNLSTLAETLGVDVISRFRKAVETGKWPNGDPLSDEQKQTCIEAIIVWERKHLPEHKRTGYVPPKTSPCDDKTRGSTANPDSSDEQPLRWKK